MHLSGYSARGSAPHARGTCGINLLALNTFGISPARAGNIVFYFFIAEINRDQPRTRGEHEILIRHEKQLQGSAPHARGTSLHIIFFQHHPGISPARAGNISFFRSIIFNLRDQPRTRGEHYPIPPRLVLPQGSAPHARGTFLVDNLMTALDGISPARAGNILEKLDTKLRAKDQPRTRGEH